MSVAFWKQTAVFAIVARLGLFWYSATY